MSPVELRVLIVFTRFTNFLTHHLTLPMEGLQLQGLGDGHQQLHHLVDDDISVARWRTEQEHSEAVDQLGDLVGGEVGEAEREVGGEEEVNTGAEMRVEVHQTGLAAIQHLTDLS